MKTLLLLTVVLSLRMCGKIYKPEPAQTVSSDSTSVYVFFYARQKPDSYGWNNFKDVHLDQRIADDGWFHVFGDSCTHKLSERWEVLDLASHSQSMTWVDEEMPEWSSDEYTKLRLRERGPLHMPFDTVLNTFVYELDEENVDIDRMKANGEIEHWLGKHQD